MLTVSSRKQQQHHRQQKQHQPRLLQQETLPPDVQQVTLSFFYLREEKRNLGEEFEWVDHLKGNLTLLVKERSCRSRKDYVKKELWPLRLAEKSSRGYKKWKDWIVDVGLRSDLR